LVGVVAIVASTGEGECEQDDCERENDLLQVEMFLRVPRNRGNRLTANA